MTTSIDSEDQNIEIENDEKPLVYEFIDFFIEKIKEPKIQSFCEDQLTNPMKNYLKPYLLYVSFVLLIVVILHVLTLFILFKKKKITN